MDTVGLFFIFTNVKLKGPNKLLNYNIYIYLKHSIPGQFGTFDFDLVGEGFECLLIEQKKLFANC